MGGIEVDKDFVFTYEGKDYKLDTIIKLIDAVESLRETKIVDVDVEGNDVICTFENGEIQTAHCHPQDSEKWSIETGIAVCLGKYLTGGSNEFNTIVRQGVRIFNNKTRAAAKSIEEELERERIRRNKRQKHERYLKRRAERKALEEKEKRTDILEFLNKLADKLGIHIEIVDDCDGNCDHCEYGED